MDKVKKYLQSIQTSYYNHQNITTVITSQDKGFEIVEGILQVPEICDKKTCLYLSGGRTPKDLYAKLAAGESIIPGAVAMIDERYGEVGHQNSNEKMVSETGFLRYLNIRDINFYKILKYGLSLEDSASEYDLKIRELLSTYQRHVGILGVGMDGHTAGIPALNSKLSMRQAQDGKIQNSKIYTSKNFAESYDDETDPSAGGYGKRVTMTFAALSMLDLYLVLVFGRDKYNALQAMFADGDEEEIPSRFYKRPDAALKTLLITDQEII